MKKITSIVLFAIIIASSGYFSSATNIHAQSPECTTLGGVCQSSPCSSKQFLLGGTCDGNFVQYCCKSDSTPKGLTNPVIGKLGNDAAAASSGATFTSYFVTIWRAIIAVGALIMLFTFVNGALDWITAGGDQSKVSKARQKMTEGVMGFIILAGSFAVIALIGQLFFGDSFNLLKITFPTP